MENIYDVIAWGRVVTQGKEYLLLSPKPYHSENSYGSVARSLWQPEGSLKWEVADQSARHTANVGTGELPVWEDIYVRSIIIFGPNALIEFYQDPKTIKVKYVTPSDDEQN